MNKRMARGFTLVEVMVAVTLFSLVMVMIFNGLHSSSLSWRAGERQIAQNDTQRLELAFLRKLLSQAVPLILIDGDENPLLFKGEEDTVYFVSKLPSHRGGGGLYLLSLHVSQQDDRHTLTMTYQPATPAIDLSDHLDSEHASSLDLIENIETLTLSYYGDKDDIDEADWHDDWDSNVRLPELISIQIETSQARRFWPELVIPIHNQAIKGQPQFSMYAATVTQNGGL